jgi:FHA domain
MAVQRSPYTVAIVNGDGLVARFGDVAVFLADVKAPVAPLLEVFKAVAGAANPGATMVERLAPLAIGGSAAVAPFGAVAPTEDGLVVLLRGKVTAEIESPDGPRQLSGERAMTWVDEVLPMSAHRIAVRRTDGSSAAAEWPHTDLHGGVVPGGGFVLRPVDAQHGVTSVTQTVAPAVTSVRGQVVEEPTTRVGGDPQAPPPAQAAGETSTMQAVTAVLESDDGAVYPLDRSYVIGRDPLVDDSARRATATPIAVQGDPHVSRVHAYISVDGGVVSVRDASTPGGTFVAAPGAADWTEIGSAQTELSPGWSLRVGERIFTYRG